ncbi:hypothetical protein [aff. Roholtiella sp. LEGE 12411]|uniref:hypothetical protein n=1 Tax=aff. Roholtiella sp. LEGE 12411 TaxID=1828822 RepID=UPI00187EA5FB|nr:hypothetical protein [aff. Roholtiella sp. LEGE 12411]MBE9034552.1 hypothetical protein [aff. Roholtiella sp. LEGE 12411]
MVWKKGIFWGGCSWARITDDAIWLVARPIPAIATVLLRLRSRCTYSISTTPRIAIVTFFNMADSAFILR